MGKNKYVDFVSDEDFLESVKWVCDAYKELTNEIDMNELQKNTLDPFKMVFDMINSKVTFDEWAKGERTRQLDKTINNKIGEFHQKLLGKVKGWKDLGTSSELGVDLEAKDRSRFIELKNKWNTMNSGGIMKTREKLEDARKKYPKATAYWGFIVGNKGESGEGVWEYGPMHDDKIRQAWGAKVYEIVTGDANALRKVWEALPKAISDLTKSDYKINEIDQKKLLRFFEETFGSSYQQGRLGHFYQ